MGEVPSGIQNNNGGQGDYFNAMAEIARETARGDSSPDKKEQILHVLRATEVNLRNRTLGDEEKNVVDAFDGAAEIARDLMTDPDVESSVMELAGQYDKQRLENKKSEEEIFLENLIEQIKYTEEHVPEGDIQKGQSGDFHYVMEKILRLRGAQDDLNLYIKNSGKKPTKRQTELFDESTRLWKKYQDYNIGRGVSSIDRVQDWAKKDDKERGT